MYSISFLLMHGITNVYPSFVPNKRKDYIPTRIIYSNRSINMHVYITSLFRTGTQKSNLVSCLVFVFSFFFVSLFSSPYTHPYVVTCVLVRFFPLSLALSFAPYNCKLFFGTYRVSTKSGSMIENERIAIQD